MFDMGKLIKILFVGFLGLVVPAPIFAGIMPASHVDAGQRLPAVCCEEDATHQGSSNLFRSPDFADPTSGLLVSFSDADENRCPSDETQSLLKLTDATTNSFDLCVYALLGLGICRTGPWIKRFSFGSVPEWFHDGGPLQIGHSHAVLPKTLGSASICCFVQPDCRADDHLPGQSQRAAISPLLRKSLFTPCVLAARGPPKREQLA